MFLELIKTTPREGPCFLPLLFQQVFNAIALFQELFEGEVHAFAREGIDFQAFDTGVFAVGGGDGNAIANAIGDAVGAIGRNATDDHVAVRHPYPLVYWVDWGIW